MGRKGALVAVSLLALTAGLASASPAKQGGIFRLGTTGSSTQIDPQVSYVTTAWWLEYATAAKLYNYADKAGSAGTLLRPEVASGFTVSNGGRTYTFTIRKGFRFSDETPVTARNLAYAIRRARDPDLNSPAAAFMGQVRSAEAKGSKLVINLFNSDPELFTKLALPFFQATSLKLPLKTEVTTGYPSAGPYYFAKNVVNELTSLRRNPYWHGNRPRHLAGVDVQWNLNEQAAYEATLVNRLDEGPIPAGEVEAAVKRFGVNKSRLWSKPVDCLGFIAFNNSSGIFAGNPALRRAVNWAINRRDYSPALQGQPWTHLLSPLTPGLSARHPYAPTANLAKARKLAAGHFRDGHVVVAYRSSGTVNPTQAQLLRRDLINLGFDPAKIEMKGFSGAQIYDQLGVRGLSGIDLFVPLGSCNDISRSDPIAQLRQYVTAVGAYGVPSAKYQAKLDAAARLSGAARLRAARKLDIEIAQNLAPIAPLRTYNNRFLFSNRVDPRSLVYSRVYQDFSIPALSLK
jgi:peptide/nickel transport system substrate-binding protein